MKEIIMVKTFDNLVHQTKRDATKHLDKLYGDIILPLSRKLCQMKYTEASDFIDENLDEFVKLKTIKDDMNTYESLEECDEGGM